MRARITPEDTASRFAITAMLNPSVTFRRRRFAGSGRGGLIRLGPRGRLGDDRVGPYVNRFLDSVRDGQSQPADEVVNPGGAARGSQADLFH